jgi:hypothetical protein
MDPATNETRSSSSQTQITQINAAAKIAKKEFSKDTYVGIKDSFLGEKLADCGSYKNPAIFVKRGLIIMAVAYSSGLTEVFAMKPRDPQFVLTTGQIQCDYAHLLNSAQRWQARQLLVVIANNEFALCLGPYSKITKAFLKLEYCFPMDWVSPSCRDRSWALMRAEYEKRFKGAMISISEFGGASGGCQVHNVGRSGPSAQQSERPAPQRGGLRNLVNELETLAMLGALFKQATTPKAETASKDAKPSEAEKATPTAEKADAA